MTLREAFIQASLELGMTKKAIERKVKYSDAVLPHAAALSHSPVKPGSERECIEELKAFFRRLDATPGAREALMAEVVKRAKVINN
jgi:acyl-CoA synthetase (NDP forming)